MRPRLKVAGLLPNAEGRRPADILVDASSLSKFMVEIISFGLGYRIDISIYDFCFQFGRIESGGAAAADAERKYRHHNMEIIGQAQNLGFEHIFFEITNGCEGVCGLLRFENLIFD